MADAVAKILVQSERELDMLVAEHVMGWTFSQGKHGYWQGIEPGDEYKSHSSFSPYYNSLTGELVEPWKGDIDKVPQYSVAEDFYYEGFKPMFQVINKVMEDAFGYSLGQNHESLPWCEFQSGTTVRKEAPTLAIAVCLAALSLRGFEIDYQPKSDRTH